MSPYDRMDLSRLEETARTLDPVSLADLYRNGFVFPPYSIFKEVRLATFGFDPAQDLHRAPRFVPPTDLFDRASRTGTLDTDAWVDRYHDVLCGALTRSCAGLRAPWMMQSGGKDSTSLAIAAAAVRPDTTCLTYLGGREEDEVDSARAVATGLGLRHEVLVCDPARAYDRYLAALPRMPLLNADFAMLSYIDLLTEVRRMGGDGAIDGVGSDVYFGAPLNRTSRNLQHLSRQWRLPTRLVDLLQRLGGFRVGYALSSLQMHPFERLFPGSRFSDAEVDLLLGQPLARVSSSRLALYQEAIERFPDPNDRRVLSLIIADAAAGVPKGMLSAHALSLRTVYPLCDGELLHWVCNVLPAPLRMDAAAGVNKVLVRAYIARRFQNLPYVAHKGSFRFDLRGLAAARFDQVAELAEQTRDLVPGAPAWLRRNRRLLDNKLAASKFYLLAVTLPWLRVHANRADDSTSIRAA